VRNSAVNCKPYVSVDCQSSDCDAWPFLNLFDDQTTTSVLYQLQTLMSLLDQQPSGANLTTIKYHIIKATNLKISS
jgi:hypothetical protein